MLQYNLTESILPAGKQYRNGTFSVVDIKAKPTQEEITDLACSLATQTHGPNETVLECCKVKGITEQQQAQRKLREQQALTLMEQLSMDMLWVPVPDNLHHNSLEDIQRFFDTDGSL